MKWMHSTPNTGEQEGGINSSQQSVEHMQTSLFCTCPSDFKSTVSFEIINTPSRNLCPNSHARFLFCAPWSFDSDQSCLQSEWGQISMPAGYLGSSVVAPVRKGQAKDQSFLAISNWSLQDHGPLQIISHQEVWVISVAATTLSNSLPLHIRGALWHIGSRIPPCINAVFLLKITPFKDAICP